MSWLRNDGEHEFDESDVRIRPTRGGSRPRSKQRPQHRNAQQGRVLAVDRGRYRVLINENENNERFVTATKARELGKNSVVTGDVVHMVGDTSSTEGTLARIVRIDERTTVLRRSADDDDAVERIIVANADQLLMVTAAANPEPRTTLIDRYLIAACDAGITPILCITKTDIRDPTEFATQFSCFTVPLIVSSPEHIPVDDLTDLLIGHSTVVVGHSGVGKSTLVNAIVPDAQRATGHVNATTGRGRHTSSSTASLRVQNPEGQSGWLIDTPGVRSFGLGHIDPHRVVRSFARLAAPVHGDDLPPLAHVSEADIIDRVEHGELGSSGLERLRSFTRLVDKLHS